MGTHPKSPSRVRSSGQVLSEYLASHPELIGEEIIDKFDAGNGNLPFLFKVLSIEKALSIQTHPDKQTAERLHAEHPDIYKGKRWTLLLCRGAGAEIR
jgi:mannose-6-phosphate isomerase